MPTLAAGASVVVSLPAGTVLRVEGVGVASVQTIFPGPGSPFEVGLSTDKVGPFAADRSVYLTAKTAMNYWVSSAASFNPLWVEKTWANRPSAAALGTGGVFTAIDVGVGGRSYWISDGTILRPLNGHVVLYANINAAIASPLATLNGDGTSKFFVLPELMIIPAGMLYPRARLYITGRVRRTALAGAPVTVSGVIHCGTLGTLSDGQCGSGSINATLNQDLAFDAGLIVESSTSFFTGTFMTWNGQGNTGFAERTANFNTASQMSVNIGINNLAVAGDIFALYAYSVALWG